MNTNLLKCANLARKLSPQYRINWRKTTPSYFITTVSCKYLKQCIPAKCHTKWVNQFKKLHFNELIRFLKNILFYIYMHLNMVQPTWDNSHRAHFPFKNGVHHGFLVLYNVHVYYFIQMENFLFSQWKSCVFKKYLNLQA